jgi:predicted nucleotide-binding protein
VFIASSVQGLHIAEAIHQNLDYDAEVSLWNHDLFALSQPPLHSLMEATQNTDFGIFVFNPDDITNIKKFEYSTVRDNVIFELGLFIGALGRERNFIVMPRNTEGFHLPTDLIGMTPADYNAGRDDGNLKAAVAPRVLGSKQL